MNFLKLLIVFVSMYVLNVSCKEPVKQRKTQKETTAKNSKKDIKYTIDFPDTVHVNQSYHGVIKYQSDFDTIITVFGNKDKNRYTRFIHFPDHLNYSIKDTFGAIDNRTIPFYHIKFREPGIFYLEGYINDLVLIDLFKKNEDGEELIRLIELNEPISKKVVVVEKEWPKGKL